MHKIFAAIALCLAGACANQALAVEDTLSYYDPDIVQFGFAYPPSGGSYQQLLGQYATFRPEAPCFINSIVLTLSGGTGQATFFLLGHAGGSFFPYLPEPMIDGVRIQKNEAGLQRYRYDLPEPVWFSDNYFFIAVQDLSSGVSLVTDTTSAQPFCETNPAAGGIYRKQHLVARVGDRNQIVFANSAFAIDVIVDYPTKTPKGILQDVTLDLGVDAELSNRSIAFADINNDDFLDMLVAGRLYINNSGTGFSDMTESAGLGSRPAANAFVDINNDGHIDILFINSNRNEYVKSIAYVNDGSGAFSPQELDLPQFIALSSFSIADVNHDSYPDIFVGQLWSEYPETGPDEVPNFLMFNNGDYTFSDRSDLVATSSPRRSRGSQFVDYDNDGDLDLFVTNYLLEQDELWTNNGDGTFANTINAQKIEPIVSTLPEYYNHGTGCDWMDYDNDGNLDLLLPQFMHPWLAPNGFQGTTLYRNNGAPGFEFGDTWRSSGIRYEETHAGGSFGDINNDGLQDVLMTVFYGCRYIDFYVQKPDHTFEHKTFDYGLENINTGTDATFVDFNNDGLLDLACGENGRIRIFQNTSDDAGNYVQLDLEPNAGNTQAIGSRVRLRAGGTEYTQEISLGRGQRMQKPARLHFGLAAAEKIDEVLVRWSSDPTQWEVFDDVAINRLVTIRQGEGRSPTSVSLDSRPDLNVLAAWPNPVQGRQVKIEYVVAQPANVRIELVSPMGRTLGILLEGVRLPGTHTLHWNCRDTAGQLLPSGMYTLRYTVGTSSYTRKLMVLR